MPPLFTALTVLYVIWLAALLLVAYTPHWFKHYTLFKAVNSILFVVIAVAASQPSAAPENPLWPRLLAFSFAAFSLLCFAISIICSYIWSPTHFLAYLHHCTQLSISL